MYITAEELIEMLKEEVAYADRKLLGLRNSGDQRALGEYEGWRDCAAYILSQIKQD